MLDFPTVILEQIAGHLRIGELAKLAFAFHPLDVDAILQRKREVIALEYARRWRIAAELRQNARKLYALVGVHSLEQIKAMFTPDMIMIDADTVSHVLDLPQVQEKIKFEPEDRGLIIEAVREVIAIVGSIVCSGYFDPQSQLPLVGALGDFFAFQEKYAALFKRMSYNTVTAEDFLSTMAGDLQ